MTHKAVIRIAQVATPDLYLTDTIKPGRELWHTHALQLAPNPVVLVNHVPDQVIGRVIELDEWDDTTGRWVFARCELDEAPGWLRGGSRGTAASMSWIDLSHSTRDARRMAALQRRPGHRGERPDARLRARRDAGAGRAAETLDRHKLRAEDPSARACPQTAKCSPHPAPSSADRAATSSGCAEFVSSGFGADGVGGAASLGDVSGFPLSRPSEPPGTGRASRLVTAGPGLAVRRAGKLLRHIGASHGVSDAPT